MKKFKELRQLVNETTVTVGSGVRVQPLAGDTNALDGDINLSSLTPAAISRINTYLGAMAAKPYIHPMEALKNAKGRLQMIGLDFQMGKDCEMRLKEEEGHSFPLVRFGGAFGADGSQYGYTQDDGITPKLGHGLALHVQTALLPNGMTQVQAQIVPTS